MPAPVAVDPVGPREAFLQAFSDELGVDIGEDFAAAADRILARMWMLGFKIAENGE